MTDKNDRAWITVHSFNTRDGDQDGPHIIALPKEVVLVVKDLLARGMRVAIPFPIGEGYDLLGCSKDGKWRTVKVQIAVEEELETLAKPGGRV